MKKILVLLILCFSSVLSQDTTLLIEFSVRSHVQGILRDLDLPYGSVHLMLGVPYDDDPSDDYLIIRNQYVLSYNGILNVCNWVSWEMSSEWFGKVHRYSGNFITDTELPINFYRVKHEDYTRSGYDRGHMVRSEERTATVEDNRSTFILTNILPQHPHLNQGVWFNFEAYLERLCKLENKKLYVIAGGIFHTKERIGGVVTVPDSCFKIVVVLNKWETTLDITEDTPIIAVVMPNTGGIRRDKWEQYRTTVSRIEYSTGYKFLSAINEIVADSLKKK